MLTNLYFVRHAHSTYTTDELNRPLSEKGYKDAERVTMLLSQEKIDLVKSSPYKRAIQTVEGTSSLIDSEIIQVDDFRERLLSTEPVSDFSTAIQKVWEDETFAWSGGESNQMAQSRGVQATIKLLEEFSGKNIAIGTHGNIMVLIMKHFDTQYDFKFWQELDMPDIYRMTFEGTKLVGVKRIWSR